MDHRPLEQNIEIWPLSRIVEYARNPRNNEPAVDRMCASIREFGFKIRLTLNLRGAGLSKVVLTVDGETSNTVMVDVE
jgi:hypothetical protein